MSANRVTPRRATATTLGVLGVTLALTACSPNESPSTLPPQLQHPSIPTAAPVPNPHPPRDPIQQNRERITHIDAQIAELIAQRQQLSARVQHERTQAGGAQLDPAREQAIIERYRATLGESGATIARDVLDASRTTPPQQ